MAWRRFENKELMCLCILCMWQRFHLHGPWLRELSFLILEILIPQGMMFVFVIFFFVIPYIRKRENVKGVRYALLGFLVVAVGLSIPSIIVNKNFNFLYNLFNHLAVYILLTFIYCPEILGMDIDLSKWFQSYKQMTIIIVYISIVTLFVFGFGWQYYQMYEDHPTNAFDIGFEKSPSYPTFVYYSIVSFTTIGYGEITPVSTIARMFTSIEAMLGMIINVVFVAILFLYISNFQAFMRSAEAEHKKEEREIKKIERKIGMRKKSRKK